MAKRKMYDKDLLQCDCVACENIRNSFEDKPKHQELTCIERVVNFFASCLQ